MEWSKLHESLRLFDHSIYFFINRLCGGEAESGHDCERTRVSKVLES